MTERLADINARIDGVQQLGTVVNAMRGIAAARAQQARGQLAAVDRYAQTIAVAIGTALDLLAPAAPPATPRSTRPALLVFAAEQGFAGAFSERVFDAVDADLKASELFLVGTRGAVVAGTRGIVAPWQSALPSHSSGIPTLADRIAEALYARIAAGAIDRLDVVFCQWQPGHGLHVERRRLFPIDLSLFARPAHAAAPLIDLTPVSLVAALVEDCLHAELCRAALHAFAAENEARMEAMAAARSQIERQLAGLQATQRRVRQDEITEEIIELAAGEATTLRP
jgi:F-type H+-transporting ATPase subunit gamma